MLDTTLDPSFPGATTVLVVDDDAMVRKMLSRLLTRAGQVRVLEAADGVTALRMLEQQPVDVVVSDEVMPSMSGVRLLETIRANWPSTRRALYTGRPDGDLVMRAINRGGAEKVLAKSMHPEELRAELAELIRPPSEPPRRASNDRDSATDPAATSVVIVADELAIAGSQQSMLRAHGFDVVVANANDALARLSQGHRDDVVLLDLSSPTTDAIGFMRRLRDFDLDCPVIVTTPRSETARAHEAMRYGAYRYLVHPVPRHVLVALATQAATLRRIAQLRRDAVAPEINDSKQLSDRAALETRFNRAIEGLFMVYQPIVSWSGRRIIGYETLVRSRETALPSPGALFDAAQRLDRTHELRRAIRALAPLPFGGRDDEGWWLFLNMHIDDMTLDEPIEEALLEMAPRIVLEVTERANIESIAGAAERIAHFRERGFRIAVDDLGAGYAGLTSFATLEPDFAKLDMTLVRGIERAPIKQRLVAGLCSACADLGVALVAEGVETAAERDTLIAAGCDLFQGYFFGRPGLPFPAVTWE